MDFYTSASTRASNKKRNVRDTTKTKQNASMNIHRNHVVDHDSLDIVDISSPPPNVKYMGKGRSMADNTLVHPLSKCDCEHCQSKELGMESASPQYSFCSPKLRLLRKNTRNKMQGPPVSSIDLEDTGKLTVVLDLDETLIHSLMSSGSSLRAAQDRFREEEHCNETVESFTVTLSDGECVKVLKRPGLDEFLNHASEKYELMIYTAGLKEYAEPVLDWMDPEGKIFRHRFYRDSCLFSAGYYVKDLYQARRDLKRTVLVDNNLCCFLPQLNNGIPISSFYDDPKDDALVVLRNFLEGLEGEDDVRHFLTRTFALETSLRHNRDALLK